MKSFGKLLTLMVLEVLLRSAQSSLQNDRRGPYNVVMKGYEDCGNENALANLYFKNQKVSTTGVIVEGRISGNFTLNDQIKMKAVMQQFNSRQWKDNYMVFDFGDKGVCTTLKITFPPDEIERIISKIVDQNNQTLTKYCDIPPGVYTISGLAFDWSGVKALSEFAYGRYRTKNMFYSSEGEIGCVMVYFDVVPKKKKQTTS